VSRQRGTLTTTSSRRWSSLFGLRLRSGVSASLLDAPPPAEDWDEESTGQGAEAKLLGHALAGRHALIEAHLGRKQLDPGAAPADLAHTLAAAVGPLFRLMERHVGDWQDVRGSRPVAERGQIGPPALASDDIRPDRMVRAFHLGLKDLLPLWEQALSGGRSASSIPSGSRSPDFHFEPLLWARVVGEFAVAHHERRLPRDHLLRALTPLYLGRVAAFLLETKATSRPGAIDALERVGLAFEAEKAALSARWR
jgi:hypothetical protein